MRIFRNLLTTFLLCLCGICHADPIVLHFAYETKAVVPYFMGDSDQIPDKPGVTPEMMLLLAKKIPNLQLQLSRMPWKRCLSSLQAGKVDAVVASYNKERQAIGVYPMKGGLPDAQYKIDTKAYYLYALENSPLTWNGKQFNFATGEALSIGAPLGYSIVDDLKQLGVRLEESNSAEKIMEKLQLQRIHGAALLEKVGDSLVQQARFRSIQKINPALASKDYYLLLSQQFVSKHPEMAKQIWQALAQLRENEGEAIMRRYLE